MTMTICFMQGVVKATEDAKRDYEAAIKQQKTAFLGEETKPDVFHVTFLSVLTIQ